MFAGQGVGLAATLSLSMALVSLGFSGCADSANRAWCEAVCAAEERCFSGTPASCADDCVRERPGLHDLSLEGVQAMAPCLEGLSCHALSDDAQWELETDACWSAGWRSVRIRSHARAVCRDYSRAWFQCGYGNSQDVCEHQLSMFGDAVLDRVQKCAAAPTCAELQACDEGVFGG